MKEIGWVSQWTLGEEEEGWRRGYEKVRINRRENEEKEWSLYEENEMREDEGRRRGKVRDFRK